MKNGKTTMAQAYEPAMAITDQAEADRYFEQLIQMCVADTGAKTREEIDAIEATQRQNLGYFAGYYSNETRARVEKLFRCAHPVFGAIAERGAPTPEEAFAMGEKMAEEAKKKGVL